MQRASRRTCESKSKAPEFKVKLKNVQIIFFKDKKYKSKSTKKDELIKYILSVVVFF